MSILDPISPARDRVRLTISDYDIYVNLPKNADTNYELFDGDLIIMPSPGPKHSWIILMLQNIFRRADPEGWPLGDNNDLVIPPHNVLIPDMLYYSRASLPRLPDRLTTPPDIVVEVSSPSNTLAQLYAKTLIYLDFGVQAVVLIFPETRMIEVHIRVNQHETHVLRYQAHETVDLSRVLVGLVFPVQAVFEGLDEEI